MERITGLFVITNEEGQKQFIEVNKKNETT